MDHVVERGTCHDSNFSGHGEQSGHDNFRENILRRSEGEYVSLGYYEKEDLATVIEYLRSLPFIGEGGFPMDHCSGGAFT